MKDTNQMNFIIPNPNGFKINSSTKDSVNIIDDINHVSILLRRDENNKYFEFNLFINNDESVTLKIVNLRFYITYFTHNPINPDVMIDPLVIQKYTDDPIDFLQFSTYFNECDDPFEKDDWINMMMTLNDVYDIEVKVNDKTQPINEVAFYICGSPIQSAEDVYDDLFNNPFDNAFYSCYDDDDDEDDDDEDEDYEVYEHHNDTPLELLKKFMSTPMYSPNDLLKFISDKKFKRGH